MPSWLIGTATNFTLPHKARNVATRGAYLVVFFCSFEWHPKSLQKPTSMRMRLHFLRSKDPGSGLDVFEIPIA